MSRKNRTPEEKARRAKIHELLPGEQYQQHGGHSGSVQGNHRVIHGKRAGCRAGRGTGLQQVRLPKQRDGQQRRNGHSSKRLKTSFGEVEVSVPRNRKGEFEPKLLKKHQTSISQDIEEKILSMYAKGMTTSDIEAHIRDIYGLEVSDTTISRSTDKILPIRSGVAEPALRERLRSGIHGLTCAAKARS